jgi:hypothetical protein
MRLSAEYHSNLTTPDQFRSVVDNTAAHIKRWLAASGAKVTHIVATGISGQSVAWPLSLALDLPVCIVRKHGEPSHMMYGGPVVGSGELGDYIIVDDLISTGETIRRVIQEINTAHDRSQFIGSRLSGAAGVRPHPLSIFLTQQPRGQEFNTQNSDFGTIPAFSTREPPADNAPTPTQESSDNDQTV